MIQINFQVRPDHLEQDLISLYRILRPEINATEIEYHEFNEGIVNSIVCLNDAKTNDPIVIRTYSIGIKKFQNQQNENSTVDQSKSFKFINRELELKALEQAGRLGITFKIIATYSNGFIYKYIDGDVNTVDRYDDQTARQVAQKLARLHSINLNCLARERPLVDMYSKIENDPYLTEKVKFNNKMKNGQFEEFTVRLPTYMSLQGEYEKLSNLISAKGGYGRICLCHNDLTLNNILIEKTSKEPFLIDFEMVNTNYQNYDIATHMLHLGGLFGKHFFVDQVPNEKFIKNFLASYHEESNKLNDVRMDEYKFDKLIDTEVRNILVIMLSIRIQMIQRCLFHNYLFPGKLSVESVKNFCFALFDDYLAKKDEQLQFFNASSLSSLDAE